MAQSSQYAAMSTGVPFGVIARGEIGDFAQNTKSELVRASRLAIGLAVETPVVMSGHQAELWHPGILAKRFAATALAELRGAQAGWVVVDTDTNEGGVVAYPSRDVLGNPTKATWDWMGGASDGVNVPLCCLPSSGVAVLPDEKSAWNAGIFARLKRVQDTIVSVQDKSRTAAEQLTHATQMLLRDVERGASVSVAMASGLCRTPIFERLWNAMIADPAGCVGAYNAAAAKVSGSGIRTLAVSGGSFELPVWQIEGKRRRAVRVKGRDDGSQININSLAPRALLLTAVMRLALCDVFIHGLGGEVYDRVMEGWLSAWLPTVSDPELRSLTLAPLIAVSATMRMTFDGVHVPTPEEIARRAWALHHARHNPGWIVSASPMAGTQNADLGGWVKRKRAVLATLNAAKTRGEEPLPHYRALHKLIEESRREFAPMLEELQKEADNAAAMKRLADVVHDRTWSFALYDAGELAKLRDEVGRRIRKVYSLR